MTASFKKQHELSFARIRAMAETNEIEFFTSLRALYDEHLGVGNVPKPENVWNGDEMAFGRGEWPVQLIVAHFGTTCLHG